MDTESVTLLLRRMDRGERGAADELYALLYDELRGRARGLVGRAPRQTLGPTAVVHEAWLRLSGGVSEGWGDRAHFFGVAAKAMRSVLVDHGRARRAQKRGGGQERVPLDDALAWIDERDVDILDLDQALERLARVDPELARLVELRYFAGLSIADTALALDTSTATVERAWRTARAWLRTALDGTGERGQAGESDGQGERDGR